MILTRYLIGAILVLCIALGVSLRYNFVQWSDARAADAANAAALKLAAAEGRSSVLERNIEVADAMADAAEDARIELIAQQQAAIAEEQRRERQYWLTMQGLELQCGPGQEFVDAFNEAMQP
jgi:hypothetical protein